MTEIDGEEFEGEEFEGEEEEEQQVPTVAAPPAAAVVDGEDEEDEDGGTGQSQSLAGDVAQKKDAKEGAPAAQPQQKAGAAEAAAAAETAQQAVPKKAKTGSGPLRQQTAVERLRVQAFCESRDKLVADAGKQWSSVYAQVEKELAAAAGSGLAGSLSVTQDAAKTLHSATADLQKLVVS